MKSVSSPRGLVPWLLVALIAAIATTALPAAAGAVPFEPGALLGRLHDLFSSIWSEPLRESQSPAFLQHSTRRPPICPDAPGGICAPILGDHGCEIEPGGLCLQH